MPPRHKPSKVAKFFEDFQTALNPARLFQRKARPARPRSVYINQALPAELFDKKGKLPKMAHYTSSQVVTSKYTVLTFLPRNLLEQFRRIANIFFLGIAILQFFPKFSTISPGLVILPLIVVLAITALKDGYEDVKRHQSDRKVNHSVVHVLAGGGYVNHNPMEGKSKTFVKGIKLPQTKAKKARKAREREGWDRIVRDEHDETERASPRAAPLTTFPGEDLRAIRTREDELAGDGIPQNASDDLEADGAADEVGWKKTIWEDVKVGDFVKIYKDEGFPADIAICATSEEEDIAYIETKNLDGETNLKSRHAVAELAHLRSARSCATAQFRIDCEAADVNMFRLNAAVVESEADGQGGFAEKKHPISLETTLLRGCVLRNTAWVIGVVIFTGADTKIVMNSGNTPSKRSKVERQMNPQVLFSLMILAFAGVVCAIVDHFNEVTWYRQGAYWLLYADASDDNPNINGLFTFFNSLITFQNIVPISLYISIEFVRTVQALFIYWDDDIKYDKTKTRTMARSWNLSDDLGQIEYIFSDKTGTLTQNAMIFQQCSIAGIVYKGDGKMPEGTLPAHTKHVGGPGSQGLTTKVSGSDNGTAIGDSSSAEHPLKDVVKDDASVRGGADDDGEVKVKLPKEVLAPFHSDDLDRALDDHEAEGFSQIAGFFTNLALCHTAMASETDGVIEYTAQSPDESALVQAAADVGFVFKGKDRNVLRMRAPGSDVDDQYELLEVLEFTSARKRMSVILRKLDDDGKLFLLIKGADNVIFERLAPGLDEAKAKTNADLEMFASEGLRTLCLAYRMITEDEYSSWAHNYHDALTSLDDREGKIADVSAQLEHSLTLLGATAIEDKLQDGVPETIADLKRAGIKVWVATGDKLETAIAIGYSTNLLANDSNLIIVRGGAYGTPNSAYDQMKSAIEQFFGPEIVQDVNYHPPGLERTTSRRSLGGGRPSFQRNRSSNAQPKPIQRTMSGLSDLVGDDNGQRPGGYSLVIEGSALTHAFSEAWTEDLLLQLSTRCNTVICCRVSPLQKAQIVHLIKDNLGVMTLAIGDGANDVSMIQAADVGVGISGEEGLQAVNSSDYAIAQFAYLKRLLLVHGHWCYLRNSNMILNFFFKNIVGVAVLFFFQIYCAWSTTYVFDYVYLLLWNVVWTIAPVIAIGLFDRDVDDDILMALPELYKQGRLGKYFGFKQYCYFVFEGVLQSAVVFFFINQAYDTTTARSDGFDVQMYEFSTVMVIGAVMVCNEFHGITTSAWTAWVFAAVCIGPFLVWAFTAVWTALPPNTIATFVFGLNYFIFRSPLFWFGVIFVCFVALLPRYLLQCIMQLYHPSDIEVMRVIRKYNPLIDIRSHPLLGGMFANESIPDAVPAKHPKEEPPVANAGRPSMHEQRPSMHEPRISMTSMRRIETAGSHIDMSTGRRTPLGSHRGFDFSAEEGGGVLGKTRSRQSQTNLTGQYKTRAQQLQDEAGEGSGPRRRPRSGTLLSLRERASRAGSIFVPKRKNSRPPLPTDE